MTRTREHLSASLGRDPTIGELAKALDIREEDVVEALNVSSPPLSLTESDDEGGGQIDLPVSSPEERISDLLSLKQVVGQLPPEDPEADRPALLLWQDPNPDRSGVGSHPGAGLPPGRRKSSPP